MFTSRRRIAIILASLVAVLVPAFGAATASAGLLTGLLGGNNILSPLLYTVDDLVDNLLTGHTALSASNCPEPVVSNPFAAYGDTRDYFLVDGGDFNSASNGWAYVGSGVDGGVAKLPGANTGIGSTKVCVGLDDPTLRFRYSSKGSAPKMRIDALFQGTSGEYRTDYITTLTGQQAMGPSPIIKIGTNTRAAAGEKTAIALIFTVSSGSWTVDDVYVDPFRSR
ncbi:MAG: hypothetical protein QOF76_2144 [Solirubrobacteraceae bacterium]|jgi:hypothetical protein|nr:hypothetical protein [Solirubrobacteraceae bacterium]